MTINVYDNTTPVSAVPEFGNRYLTGHRTSHRQPYTDDFYRDFATEANRLYQQGLYSLPLLNAWANSRLPIPLSSENTRSTVALVRKRGLLQKPGYNQLRKAKAKAKAKPKVTKPKATKAVEPVVVEPVATELPWLVEVDLTTDDLMDFIIQCIYCNGDRVPLAHIIPLTRFRTHVDHLLEALK